MVEAWLAKAGDDIANGGSKTSSSQMVTPQRSVVIAKVLKSFGYLKPKKRHWSKAEI